MASPATEPEFPIQQLATRPVQQKSAELPRAQEWPAKPSRWESIFVFLVTMAVLSLFTPRIVSYLDPTTGDEPFYLMTAISLIKDGDLNECNNYINHDELLIYPSIYGFSPNGSPYVQFPSNWVGWRGSPLPLPPHPAIISPASRQCSSNYRSYPVTYDNPSGELYSKHGLGLSLMVLPAFALGGRILVVFFLNMIGAFVAVNVFLLARESALKLGAALMTWIAFAFTVPQMPYSYLIFTELPAALLTIYAFRRIRMWNNNIFQTIGIGLCAAFLPWLHYRYAPICIGLAIYYIYQMRKHRDEPRNLRLRNTTVLVGIVGISAGLLLSMFYARYGTPWPNGSDHAGISDVAGTLRGAAGLFLDQQWGLLVAAPIFILAFVGVILMWISREWRRDLIWIGVTSILYFLLIANYAQWWGEWCPPARYLAPILPLFALPFAISLNNIKGVIYKGLYGILMLFSLLTMWGFIYQPQWMYNQPIGTANAKSELFSKGLLALSTTLKMPFINKIDLSHSLPSFVSPYFYYTQNKNSGDIASAMAWRDSLIPLAVITFIIFISLLLARTSVVRPEHPDTEGGATPMGGTDDGLGAPETEYGSQLPDFSLPTRPRRIENPT